MGMGTEDDHVANKESDQRKIQNQYGRILIWETEGQDRIQMEIDGKMRKTSETMENVGNNGKRRKQRKTSETMENVGNNGKCRKQRKVSETMEDIGNNRKCRKQQKTSENNRKCRKRRNWNWWKYGT